SVGSSRGLRSSSTDTDPTESRRSLPSASTWNVRPSSAAYVPAYGVASGTQVAAGGVHGSGGPSPASAARTVAIAARRSPSLPPAPFWRITHERPSSGTIPSEAV